MDSGLVFLVWRFIFAVFEVVYGVGTCSILVLGFGYWSRDWDKLGCNRREEWGYVSVYFRDCRTKGFGVFRCLMRCVECCGYFCSHSETFIKLVVCVNKNEPYIDSEWGCQVSTLVMLQDFQRILFATEAIRSQHVRIIIFMKWRD